LELVLLSVLVELVAQLTQLLLDLGAVVGVLSLVVLSLGVVVVGRYPVGQEQML
jgi:hypothetical protein